MKRPPIDVKKMEIEEILFLRYGQRNPKKDAPVLLGYPTLTKLLNCKSRQLETRVYKHFKT